MQTEQSTQNNGVDLPELLARVEYDRDLLREVFGIFKEEFPQLSLALKEAVAQHDIKQVRNLAHSVKGMLASLSFTKASASAMCIERMAVEGLADGIPAELARLDRNTAAAQARLEAVCNEVVI